MVDAWYYKWEGMEYGPVTFDTLFHLAHAGAVAPETEVKQGDTGKWVEATAIVGLIAETEDDGIEAVVSNGELPEDDVSLPMWPVTTPTADVNAQFYWRSFGQEFGPVPFETFHEMIQREEISGGDDIRIEAPEGWLAFRSLKGIAASIQPPIPAAEFALQPGADQPAASDPFADMADMAGLESADPDDIFDDVMSAPAPPPPSQSVAAPAAPVEKPPAVAVPPAAAQPVAPAPAASAPTPSPAPAPTLPKPSKPKRTGPLIDWGAMFSGVEFSPKLLGLLAVPLVIAAYMFIPWGSGADKADYEALVKIQQEFRQLRSSGASPAQWKAFEEKTILETTPIVTELGKRATARDKIPQSMLFAARDHLPKMLKSAREEPNDDERQFDEHLENARKMMAGEALVPVEPSDDGAGEGDKPEPAT